jgi:hypothetical protein
LGGRFLCPRRPGLWRPRYPPERRGQSSNGSELFYHSGFLQIACLRAFYYGSPEINTSNVSFPDAVCIWSGPGCDWSGAIESIKPNPKAGRAEREVDAIPFHAEQLQAEHEALEELVELRDQGIVEWDFMQIDDAALIPIPAEELSASERRLIRITHDWGRKSLKLVPAMISLMSARESFGQWYSTGFGGRSLVRCGGTEIRYGSPPVYSLFDDGLITKRVALIPHLRAKGPNGAWFIRRGLNHPDIRDLSTTKAYYLTHSEEPDIFYMHEPDALYPRELAILQLFTSRPDAQYYADILSNDGVVKVMVANGAELMKLTGLCDLIEIYDFQLPVTWRAARYAKREIITAVELADALQTGR